MIRYILCDVEGTTTDIQFVHKELFPYAARNLAPFFERNPEEKAKSATHFSISPQMVVEHLQTLIRNDVKDKELKRVQGLIWQDGYASDALRGHVYPDVKPAFERWISRGIRIGIYSSGSVKAQKLIYGHSTAGDLTPYLSHHFDLAVGYKYESESYRKIVTTLEHPAEDILFLSDVERELDCAKEVGMQTIRLFRDDILPTKHRSTSSFSDIDERFLTNG